MTIMLKEATDYFEELATQHVELNHSTTNVAFCRYMDNEQFLQLRNNASRNLLIVQGFFGGVTGEFDDAVISNSIIIRPTCYAKSISSADIISATERSLQLVTDIIARMREDFEQDNCSWLKWVDFDRIQFDEIEQPWLQNHYGWDLVIPFRTHIPTYDANRWKS